MFKASLNHYYFHCQCTLHQSTIQQEEGEFGIRQCLLQLLSFFTLQCSVWTPFQHSYWCTSYQHEHHAALPVHKSWDTLFTEVPSCYKIRNVERNPLLLPLYIQQLVKCLNNGSIRRGADCEYCFFKSDMAWTRVPWTCCSFLVWLRALLICTESADKISAKFAFQHGLQPFSCLPSQYCRRAMTLAGACNQDHAATSRGWRIWRVTSWCHPPHPVSCV